jgi:hypothetical protein
VHVPAQSAKGPGQVVVPFVVKVPDKATPGDHVGGIVASLRSVGTDSKSQNVILVQRIGTRVFILVAGKLAPRIALTDVHTSYGGTLNPAGRGRVRVSYLVSNTGNVDLSVDQAVSASGLLGSKQHADLAGIALLIPGGSVHESVVLSGVWPELTIHSTIVARPFAIPGSTVSGLAPVTAGSSTWAIPWLALAVLALVLLAAVVLVLRSRVRARARARTAARRRSTRPQVVNA